MTQRPRSTDAALLPSVRRRHPRRSSGAPYLEPLRKHRTSHRGGGGQRLATASVEPLDDRPRTLGRPPSLPPLPLDSADAASPARSGESRELEEMKRQVDELQNSLAAATARAEVAERALAARGSSAAGPTDMEQRLVMRNWRLSSQLGASKRRSSPRPQPPPPPSDVVDPAAGLIDWLAAGGTDQLCSVAAKTAAETVRLCGHGPSDTGAIQSAFAAAAAAAAQEVCGIDTIKAALEAAAASLTSAIGLRPTSSMGGAVESCLNQISNLQAREWWRGYIGERHSVRSQSVIAAFAAWFLKHGLSEAEAQIFGALAVYGIDADEDGDITVIVFHFHAFQELRTGLMWPADVLYRWLNSMLSQNLWERTSQLQVRLLACGAHSERD